MSAKITIVVSEDPRLAEEQLFAMRSTRSLIWPESELHPKHHFAAVATQIKVALSGDPLVIRNCPN